MVKVIQEKPGGSLHICAKALSQLCSLLLLKAFRDKLP
jgi:hypothetical protein